METFYESTSKDMDQDFDKNVSCSLPIDDSTVPWDYLMRREKQMIIPGLYLGPYRSAIKCKLQELIDDGITHIICVREANQSKFIKPNFPESFNYLVLDIADTNYQNILPYFPKVERYIKEAFSQNGKVLIHGNAGISISASLVISYIMSILNLSTKEAFKFVQKKRFCVHPNINFMQQLCEYEPILKARKLIQENRSIYSVKRSLSEVECDEPIDDS